MTSREETVFEEMRSQYLEVNNPPLEHFLREKGPAGFHACFVGGYSCFYLFPSESHPTPLKAKDIPTFPMKKHHGGPDAKTCATLPRAAGHTTPTPRMGMSGR